MEREINFTELETRYFWTKKHFRVGLLIGLIFFSFFTFLLVRADSSDYFFTTTLIAPSNNPIRAQYAQLIANELPKIGIRANLLLVGCDVLIPRLFGSLTCADYNGGGFDIGFIGWTGSIIPSGPFQYFHSSYIDPASWPSNYYPVNNTTLDGILEHTMNTTDFNQRKAWIAKALKSVVWDIHPVTGIYQQADVFYLRDNIQGFVPNLFPAPELMSFSDGQSAGHGNVNELIVASTTQPQNYNFLISNSWYDTIVLQPTFEHIITQDTDLNFIPGLAASMPYPVAEVNNYDGLVSSTDPNTATVWEIELRQDIYWHEGYGYRMDSDRDILKFDADDVMWYYRARINAGGSSFTSSPFGYNPEKALVKVDQYTVQFHLTTIYADLFIEFACACIVPQHILDATYDAGYGPGVRKDGTSVPSYGDWDTDDYNLGKRTSSDTTHAATIGNGAYILYPGKNEFLQTVTLAKNPHYFKDNDTEYWQPLVQRRPDEYVYTWIPNKDVAEIALENGLIDIMDIGYAAERDFAVMKTKPGITTATELDWGYQTMGYNILNGAGGKLANKWVRLAISHMIPRQYIVDYLLGGLGQPSFVPFAQQSPFWPEELAPITYNVSRAIEYMGLAGYNVNKINDALMERTTDFGIHLSDVLKFGLPGIFCIEIAVICYLIVLIRKRKNGK
ncbi:MAG: ABC transporter substrate-binding protein [Candidatus Hodarchaeota archaeon]